MTKLANRGSAVKFPDLFNWSESPWGALAQFWSAQTFRLEHYAEDGRFVVRAELPGVDVDNNVDVTISDGILRIRAERHEEHREGRRSEFRYGSLSRSVELPRRAEADKVTASYENGILEIVVPLAESAPADKRVEITPAT